MNVIGMEPNNPRPNHDRESFIHEIKKIIDNAKTSLERELSRTENNRLACFRTPLAMALSYRTLTARYRGLDDKQKEDIITKKFRDLTSKTKNLQKIYTGRYGEPKDEEKESLFADLQGIKKLIK